MYELSLFPSLKDTIADLKIYQCLFFILCVENFTLEHLLLSEIYTREICEICLETFRSNKICSKLAYFLRDLQTSRINKTREFSGLGMRNFWGIVFIWTQAYGEIFKSALVYP